MIKLYATTVSLLLAGFVAGITEAPQSGPSGWHEDLLHETPSEAIWRQAIERKLAGSTHEHCCAAVKLAADAAHGQTCEHFAHAAGTELEPAAVGKRQSAGKHVTVSALVNRALQDQARLLQVRKSELERWSRADQVRFAKWFGTSAPAARKLVYNLTLLNREYSVGNFRKAVPSRPGLFAFVHPTDPSKIFVDAAFVVAPFLGENSRAGTISHEMSHFKIAGGTQDFVYGVEKCKLLAHNEPGKALFNADNFEFFMENAP
jgi:hypothetical protein